MSAIFGQGRSDYVNFTGVQVPNVFFSDSTGPCYHTAQDEVERRRLLEARPADRDRLPGRAAASRAQPGGRRSPAPTRSRRSTTRSSLQSVTHAAITDLSRFTAAQQTAAAEVPRRPRRDRRRRRGSVRRRGHRDPHRWRGDRGRTSSPPAPATASSRSTDAAAHRDGGYGEAWLQVEHPVEEVRRLGEDLARSG